MSANGKSRRNKTLRIVFAFITGLFLCAYVASAFFTVGYHGSDFGSDYWAWIGSGALVVETTDPNSCFLLEYPKGVFWSPGWTFFLNNPPLLNLSPNYRRYTPGVRHVLIPLWLALIPVLGFAAFLVYRERTRRVPGFCRNCGYDLSGNTSGRCSECGKPIPEEQRAPNPLGSMAEGAGK
jgi:hypothetical protein